MLDATTVLKLFETLNAKLQSAGVRGEIGICGGAVMCLVFKARESTKDIEQYYPRKTISPKTQYLLEELLGG